MINIYKLGIVLVEPRIPQNAGNVARTCAVTGASLHLVKPMGFEVTDKHLKRSGLDYWHELDITYYENFDDFCTRTQGEYFYFSTKGRIVHSNMSYPDNSFLIFGREDKGLPEPLLRKNIERCVRIPMRGGLRCLNLSSSVAVAAYEVLRQWDYPGQTEAGFLPEI